MMNTNRWTAAILLGLFAANAAAAADEAQLRALAARCGSELGWATTWDEAAARARAQQRPILVAFEDYGGLVGSQVLRQGPLMVPEIVQLVNARYVPFEMNRQTPAPFRSSFGLGTQATFGAAFLVLTPDGTVVAQTSITHPRAVYLYLKAVAAYLQRTTPAPAPPATLSPLEQSAWLMVAGRLEEALPRIEQDPSAAARRLHGDLLRRMGGRATEALGELRAARLLDGSLDPDLLLEEAAILMGEGRQRWAGAHVTAFLQRHPNHARVPEALFLLASLQARLDALPSALQTLNALADNHPQSRWAWKGAATALSLGLVTASDLKRVRKQAPSDAEIQALFRPAYVPLPVTTGSLTQAQGEAAVHLLDTQRDDGSWPEPVLLSSTHSTRAGAITAIGGLALLPLRSQSPSVEEAVDRSLSFCLSYEDATVTTAGGPARFSGAVWNDLFQLWFYAACLRAGAGDAGVVGSAAQARITALEQTQLAGGGWAYAALPGLSSNSTSFVTAAVVLALLEARAAGLSVPDAVLGRALDGLSAMREPDGSFRYFLGDASTQPAGAAGRSALCALALHSGGRLSALEVRRSFTIYVQHRAALIAQRGKALLHTGPQAQGVHYLSFDLRFLAAAVRVLPAAEQPAARAMVLGDQLALRVSDGGFSSGYSGAGIGYPNAMALLTLQDLSRP